MIVSSKQSFGDVEVFNEDDAQDEKDVFISESNIFNNRVSATNFRKLSSKTSSHSCEKVGPLSPEKIRWFYCTKNNELKPMIGYDSIRLENAWRMHYCDGVPISNIQRVSIRGGVYEADVIQLKCYPIYWSLVDANSEREEGETIIRGSWFFEMNWLPVNEFIAAKIEKEHLRKWQGYCNVIDVKEFDDNLHKHFIQLEGCHVEWFSADHIVYYKDAKTHRALRNIVQKFGVSKAKSGGLRLQRGYFSPAMFYETYTPVTHIVLVIHGIGAKSDRYKIVRRTAEFRALFNCLKAKKLSARVEFIPVEWRSKVLLDGDLVHSITPLQSPGVRKFVNDTILDVLYYTSSLYRNDIVCGLRKELNRIYKLFMQNNPDFNGKICILAHSLGSVILRDILIDWKPANERNSTIDIFNTSETPLTFKPDLIFCVGSPLGLFLCLRGYRPPSNRVATQNDIIPLAACRRIFNIFHPADPIAYRLEPLIMPHYTNVPPIQISFSLASKTKNLSFDRSRKNSSVKVAIPSVTSLDATIGKSSKIKSMSFAVAGNAARLLSGDVWKKRDPPKPGLSQSKTSLLNETSFVPQLPAKDSPQSSTSHPKLERRLDFQLPVGFTEGKLGYAPLTAHTSYWCSQDLALFILKQLSIDTKI